MRGEGVRGRREEEDVGAGKEGGGEEEENGEERWRERLGRGRSEEG